MTKIIMTPLENFHCLYYINVQLKTGKLVTLCGNYRVAMDTQQLALLKNITRSIAIIARNSEVKNDISFNFLRYLQNKPNAYTLAFIGALIMVLLTLWCIYPSKILNCFKKCKMFVTKIYVRRRTHRTIVRTGHHIREIVLPEQRRR